MTNLERRAVALHLASAAGALVSALAVVGCAATGIDVPAGQMRLMTVAAHGVQIHECRAQPGQAAAWAFVAPDADLFDADGRRVGDHGAGPSWQHEDGSGFIGTVRASAPSPDPNAIAWLLLSAAPRSAPGAFSRITTVQRVNTVGGRPPSFGCDGSTVGRRVHMAYRADYVLHVPGTQ
jgi:hypothetical protein